MNISRVVVKSEKSVMTSATGDVKVGIELEATLTQEEGSSPEHVNKIVKYLQDSADATVEAHLRSKLPS